MSLSSGVSDGVQIINQKENGLRAGQQRGRFHVSTLERSDGGPRRNGLSLAGLDPQVFGAGLSALHGRRSSFAPGLL